MDLTILSPHKKETYEIQWLELNTPTGNYIIQPGHAPMILSLTPEQPVTICLQSGATQQFTPRKGIVEITRTAIRMILSESI